MIWLAVLGLCAVTFLFAGIEAGLLSVDPVRLRHHVKNKTPGARRLARLLEEPERLLVTVLVVTNAADIIALLLATREVVTSIGHAGYFIMMVVAIPIHLFLLVLPKSPRRRVIEEILETWIAADLIQSAFKFGLEMDTRRGRHLEIEHGRLGSAENVFDPGQAC